MKETRKDVYLRNDSRYHNHETRPDLAGEHLKGDTYQLIAFFYFHWINSDRLLFYWYSSTSSEFILNLI